MSLSLYDLSDEVIALDDLAAMDLGEWTDEHQQLADGLMAQLVQKADAFGAYVRTMEARAASCDEEIARLTQRKKSATNRVEWMKRYALIALQRMERPKVEGALFTLAVQNNPPSVQVDITPDALPPEFVRVIPEKREADRVAIGKALKAGTVVPGCELVHTQSVRVR